MLRALKCVFLMTVLFGATFQEVFIRGVFEMNRDYVEQQLCDNREAPQLQCHGKCVLQKALEGGAQGDTPMAPIVEEIQKIHLFSQAYEPREAKGLLAVEAVCRDDEAGTLMASGVFHPPRCS